MLQLHLASTLFPYTTLFRSPARRLPLGAAAIYDHGQIKPSGGVNHVPIAKRDRQPRSEEHTSELQSRRDIVCRLLLEKKHAVSAGLHGVISPCPLARVSPVV